jgi:PAS domain S-box-containing protein
MATFGDPARVDRPATVPLPPPELDESLGVWGDAVLCGMVAHGPGGEVLYANRAAERLLGMTLAEMRALPPGGLWTTLVDDGDDQPSREPPAAISLRTQAAVRGALLAIRRPDGGRRWLQLDAVPLRGPGGAPLAVSSFVEPAEPTRRQREESAQRVQEARKSEREAQTLYEAALAIGSEPELSRRLERVLDAALALLDVHQATLALVDTNTGLVEVVAERGGKLQGKGVRMPVGVGLIGTVVAQNAPLRVADARQDPRVWDLRRVMAEGTRAWLGVPLGDRPGAFGALVVRSRQPSAFDDEAERLLGSLAALATAAVREARLYQQAREAVRVRDEFLASVSHDLNNPLTIIKGRAELLRRRARRDPARTAELEDLVAIDRQVEAMRRLLGQLVDASRLEMGQELRLRLQEVDLAALAGRLADQYRSTTSRHQIDVRATTQPIGGHWDPDRLEQIVGNLLSNAIKYSPRGGPVLISVDRDGDTARLAVQDHGLGIPPEAQPRLFKAFSRVPSGEGGGRIKGLGLGLFSAQRLAEQHGGRITLQSQPGDGSTFTLALPLGEPDDGAAPRGDLPE